MSLWRWLPVALGRAPKHYTKRCDDAFFGFRFSYIKFIRFPHQRKTKKTYPPMFVHFSVFLLCWLRVHALSSWANAQSYLSLYSCAFEIYIILMISWFSLWFSRSIFNFVSVFAIVRANFKLRPLFAHTQMHFQVQLLLICIHGKEWRFAQQSNDIYFGLSCISMESFIGFCSFSFEFWNITSMRVRIYRHHSERNEYFERPNIRRRRKQKQLDELRSKMKCIHTIRRLLLLFMERTSFANGLIWITLPGYSTVFFLFLFICIRKQFWKLDR